jgi:hypothetical protein
MAVAARLDPRKTGHPAAVFEQAVAAKLHHACRIGEKAADSSAPPCAEGVHPGLANAMQRISFV